MANLKARLLVAGALVLAAVVAGIALLGCGSRANPAAPETLTDPATAPPVPVTTEGTAGPGIETATFALG